MTATVQPFIESARFYKDPVAAVPVVLDPLVTVPVDFAGLLTNVSGSLTVNTLSPSGTTYQLRIYLNGVPIDVANVDITETVAGLVAFDQAVDPPVPLAAGDTLEGRIIPLYGPAGTVDWLEVTVYASLLLSSVQPPCPASDAAGAAYSPEELTAILKSSADSTYLQPILEAGDGQGAEVFGQMLAQFSRVSEAVERTTQALFILPWSGETSEPSHGPRAACVPLLFTRTARVGNTVVISPDVPVTETETDTGSPSGVVVDIGRHYMATDLVVFNPGEACSLFVEGVAEKVGYGYNNPRPETLISIVQSGVGFHHDRASVVRVGEQVKLVAWNEPDTFVPQHVGQYVRMTAGANIGRVARIVGYEAADLSSVPATGGTVLLERLVSFRAPVFGVTLRFQPGEMVYQPSTGAEGRVLRQSGLEPYFTVSVVMTKGEFVLGAGEVVVGNSSGSFAVLDPTLFPDVTVLEDDNWVPESVTASWEIPAWEDLWGMSVTNPAQPSGGRTAYLDGLGRERNVNRLTSEDDDTYRKRITEIADTVCPTAILRAMNRVLLPLNIPGIFREVGTLAFPGIYYDVDPGMAPDFAFAYDMDFTARPQDKHKLYLDWEEMRAFFIICLPRGELGEFGFAYDDHPLGAYDSAPVWTFYDGYAWISAKAYLRLWDAIKERVAAGVGYAFHLED